MARAFGNADFLVYGETAVTIDSKEKVGLVAIHPHTGTGVVAEFKRLTTDQKIRSATKDVVKLARFRLSTKLLNRRLKIRRWYGMIAAITWTKDYAAWWTSEDAEHEHLDSLWTSLQRNSAKGDAHWDVFPLSNDPAVQTLNTG